MPWLTPDSIPEDDDCRPLSIPSDSTWLALISGALTELTLPYNWEKFGALTVEETVAKMRSIIDSYYASPCAACTTPGGYRVLRVGASGHLEELDPNGDWVDATDEYHIPPPSAREEGSPDDQICLAAKNAVNVLEQLYEQLSEAWASHLSEAEAVTEFILAATAIVGFEFAPITWAIVAFFAPIFALLYTALEYLGADLWDEPFTQQITCFLVECANNDSGVVTFDWECFNAHLNSLADSFGLSEVQLRLYLQVGYILYFIGGVDGLNLAARTTEITNDDCSYCELPFCVEFDFTHDGGDLWTWHIVNSGGVDYGAIGATGIVSHFFPTPGNPDVQALWTAWNIGGGNSFNLTRAEMDVYYPDTANNTWAVAFNGAAGTDGTAPAGDSTIVLDDGVAHSWGDMAIYLQAYSTSEGDQIILKRLRMYGDPPIPEYLDGIPECP